jgi:hypothetical protein
MSNATSQVDVHTPFDAGPALQFLMLPTALNLSTSVPANNNVVSNVIITNGYKALSFACTSSQTGSVSIQRYLDSAGTILQGAALTVSLSAATAAVLNNSDNAPFQSLKITVNNSAGSIATLTNCALLLQAN